MKNMALVFLFSLVLGGAPAQDWLVDGFQRGGGDLFLYDPSWVMAWRKQHYSKMPKGYDVVFLIIKNKPSKESSDTIFETYALLKVSSDILRKVEGYYLLHADGDVAKFAYVKSDLVRPFAKSVWKLVADAGVDTQGENLALDSNLMVYLFAGEPKREDVFGSLIMVEAINPPDGGALSKVTGILNAWIKDFGVEKIPERPELSPP